MHCFRNYLFGASYANSTCVVGNVITSPFSCVEGKTIELYNRALCSVSISLLTLVFENTDALFSSHQNPVRHGYC